MAAQVSFLQQNAPIDEYGRALYAVGRSVLRALLDSLSDDDLADLNSPINDVTLRQLAKVVRLDRDKGMRGDGFEWAVHEAVLGQEPLVIDPISEALKRASKYVGPGNPTSLMFGYERAKYLGFAEAVVDQAGTDAFLCPEGSGRPFQFGPWVSRATMGAFSEPFLADRIKKIWKTDLFLSAQGDSRFFAATVKSNFHLLEGGRGLRLGIVPESTSRDHRPGVEYNRKHGLWLVTLPDPNGFTGLFNDGYNAIGRAMCTLGKQQPPSYWAKPSAKAMRVQEQLEKYPTAKVIEIEHALDEAAQQNLLTVKECLVGVNAPSWLHIKQMAPKLIAPKPRFDKID